MHNHIKIKAIMITSQKMTDYHKNGQKHSNQKELNMPLISGKKAKTRAGFSENIKREMNAGKPQKQAIAIAYSKAKKGKKIVKK
jgi:hypothetical protein